MHRKAESDWSNRDFSRRDEKFEGERDGDRLYITVFGQEGKLL
jgi:hypothetical protein